MWSLFSRLFILQGPDTDREEESEMSASEMKEQREKQKKEAELLRQAEIEEAERKAELLKKREESKVSCSVIFRHSLLNTCIKYRYT